MHRPLAAAEFFVHGIVKNPHINTAEKWFASGESKIFRISGN
jgi:hypothetical protein